MDDRKVWADRLQKERKKREEKSTRRGNEKVERNSGKRKEIKILETRLELSETESPEIQDEENGKGGETKFKLRRILKSRKGRTIIKEGKWRIRMTKKMRMIMN